MPKLYRIKLSPEERQSLEKFTQSGDRVAAKKVIKARALLLCDESDAGPACTDEQVMEATGMKPATLVRLRKRVHEVGPLEALERKPQASPSRRRIVDGEVEARLTQIACSAPPEGRSRWTLRLLAEKLVELEVVDSISHETVRTNMEKNIKPWLSQCWCIPPKENASFVASMEEILEVYRRPYDSKRPLVCLDEFCKQLLGEVAEPLPASPGTPARYDYEYVREGSATAFMIYAPLEGRRRIFISRNATRTKLDYAEALRIVSDEMFPDAEKIVLVEDNLNTHGNGSLYEAFAPTDALRLAQRFERHHTPKHGSWLNIAESEIAAVLCTSIKPRVATREEFEAQCNAACAWRNAECRKTDWHFTCEQSRVKLSSLYPSFLN